MLVALVLCGCGNHEGAETSDRQLRAVLREAGITALDPGPSPEPAMVALGQALFFDKELSGNRDVSCATCHHPLHHTADGISISIGVGGTGLGPERRLGPGREFIARNLDCVQCHTELIPQLARTAVHDPFLKESCTTCHTQRQCAACHGAPGEADRRFGRVADL